MTKVAWTSLQAKLARAEEQISIFNAELKNKEDLSHVEAPSGIRGVRGQFCLRVFK
jgi:hypothetical protein